ncbi:acyl-CoA thioesterase [Calidifontibacillus oryziterrae]|uniref:acyl-CoA thioesterase n=1 Tax=Calidifontibacillus oryziterrae TaxID=1191699 RepID=UPI0002F7167E|nr:thioesterase family protein [Calidifontibacillus oryziterrae]
MSRISYIEDQVSWEEEFSFFCPVKVRFSETDMFGHLNNTIPFIYFEQARIEFFRDLGFMDEWIKPSSENMIVVADLQCDFLKQVYFNEQLRIYVKAGKIGNSSVDIHYMGKNEKDTTCFVGRGSIVQISKKTGKAAPWSAEWKEILENKLRESR